MTHRFLPLFALAGLAIFFVTACTKPPTTASSSPSTASGEVFKLDVAQVNIVEEYKPPMQTPNVDHLFPTTPLQATKSWINSRIKAAGKQNTLEVTILDASVVEVKLPHATGVKGWFKKEPAERYDGHIAVEMKIFVPGKLMSEANVHVEATQSRSLQEGASLAEREALFNTLNNDLLNGINSELEKNIRAYFNHFIVR